MKITTLSDRREITEKSGLGEKIRSLRNEMGLSQAELAAEASLSQGYLSQIESGEFQNPSASHLLNLAAALGVDPNVLLEAIGYPTNDQESRVLIQADPELLSFVAGLPGFAQHHLCLLLWSFGGREPKDIFDLPKTSRFGKLNPTSSTSRNLGGEIRKLRDQLGFTQGQLAKESSLSQGYLSQLENGEIKNPSAEVLRRVALTLKVDPDGLFEAAGYPTSRSIQDIQTALRSRIIPDLYELLAELPREIQRRLLQHLKVVKTLFEKEKQRARFEPIVTT